MRRFAFVWVSVIAVALATAVMALAAAPQSSARSGHLLSTHVVPRPSGEKVPATATSANVTIITEKVTKNGESGTAGGYTIARSAMRALTRIVNRPGIRQPSSGRSCPKPAGNVYHRFTVVFHNREGKKIASVTASWRVDPSRRHRNVDGPVGGVCEPLSFHRGTRHWPKLVDAHFLTQLSKLNTGVTVGAGSAAFGS